MKTVELLDVEVQLLEKLFKDLEDKYAYAGCNDFEIESTPEMNLLVAIVEKDWEDRAGVPEEARSEVHFNDQGDITTSDFMVLEHFQRKFVGVAQLAERQPSKL